MKEIRSHDASPESILDDANDFGAWVLLIVLTVAYFCSTLDRILISLLVDPIRADLGISDTQIGLLQGPAFLLVYATSAIPLGFLVDRLRRVRIIAAGIGGWSLATALCGLADSFWKLFAARAAVGIGEATLSPAAYSLIADRFSKRRLGLAYGIYAVGGFLGSGLSLMIGGLMVQALTKRGAQELPLVGLLQPWQLCFIIFALPGFVLALIFALMREPARRAPDHSSPARPGRAVLDYYRRHRGFLAMHHIMVGTSNLALLAAASWVVPMFARVHGWEPAAIGLAAGFSVMFGGLVGLLVSGVMGDRAGARVPHARLLVCAGFALLGLGTGLAYPLVAKPIIAIALFGILIGCASVPLGVGNAALQQVVPAQIRGAVSAIYFFSLSMVTMLGPMLVAMISDRFFPYPHGIAHASAIVLPVAMLCVTLLSIACIRPYRHMLAEQAGGGCSGR